MPKRKNDFKTWLAKRKKRFSRMVSIESAFFTNKYQRYIFYRLRLFLLNSLGSFALHALEFFLVFHYMEKEWLVASLIFGALKIVVSGAWWGGLEQMRSSIRTNREESRSHLTPKLLSSWLSGSVYIASTISLLTILGLSLQIMISSNSLSPFHFYALATALNTSLGMVIRTYHSGAFALRRVYRPVLSIIGIRILGFLLTLLFFPVFGPWAMPLVILVNGLIGHFLTYYYSAKAIKALRIKGIYVSLRFKYVWRSFFKRLEKTFFLGSLASGLMRFDAKIVILILYSLHDSKVSSLFLFFYLIRPIIHMSHDWAQLFYFDSVKLDLNSFSNLKAKFEKNVALAGFAMGTICWGLCVLIGKIVAPSIDLALYLSLGAFFLVYPFVSYMQVRVFSEKLFPALIASLLLVALSIYLLLQFSLPMSEVMLAITFILLLSLSFLFLRDRIYAHKLIRQRLIPLPSWVKQSSQYKTSPVRVCWLTLAKNPKAHSLAMTPRQRLTLLKNIESLTGLTLIKGSSVMWLCNKGQDFRKNIFPVAEKLGGSIKIFGFTELFENSSLALKAAFRTSPLSSTVMTKREVPKSLENLLKDFSKNFSKWESLLVKIDSKFPKKLPMRITQDAEKAIIRGAFDFATDPWERSRSRDFDITTFCDGDELKYIFVLKTSVPLPKRLAWRETVVRQNILL